MLFLSHLASKMRPVAEGGGRAAIVLNGSPLFNGAAESGESAWKYDLVGDQQTFAAGRVGIDANGPILKLRFQISMPEIGGFEYV